MIVRLPFPTLRIDTITAGPGLWLKSMDKFEPSRARPVEYRPTFAGSVRAFISPETNRTFDVGCTLAEPDEHQWLRAHMAEHLLFRFDDVRLFGMYERYLATPYAVGNLYSIRFTVTEVTHPEAV